jgi:hypothetical protein
MCERARRKPRVQRERRLDTLTVEVRIALGERDAAVAALDAGPGHALSPSAPNKGCTIEDDSELASTIPPRPRSSHD